ncbi:MAG: Holliday junction branch migration protein RuvA [Gammaproteobacteria bacterium]|mgnify:FL=1|jgi:Holliday junction DNA helicase RuvA|nr:Holliday junction branch migration protein RuvA [Gammaproteobacteria bacterium]
MISQIKGWLLEIQDQQLVLDVGGIGYEVEVPLDTALRLHSSKELVQLYTHFVVREESHTLFGFLNRSDRDLFRALIKVNKVGPRLALSILSALDAKGFARLIQLNDIKTLNGIPGVGRVMAERLIMEMRDKVEEWQDAGGAQPLASGTRSKTDDAEAALIGLGYKPQEVTRVLAQIQDPADNIEGLIRQALKLLG